jgi:hypothetical protein
VVNNGGSFGNGQGECCVLMTWLYLKASLWVSFVRHTGGV